MTINIGAWVVDRFDQMFGERVFSATVTGTSGNLVTIKRPGQVAADPQSYPRLVSYATPTAADEVMVLKLGDGWICVGKITR
jgi:hypothetical protein